MKKIQVTLVGSGKGIGGTAVLFNQLINELKKYENLQLNIIDTTRSNNRNIFDMVSKSIIVFFQVIHCIWKSDVLSLHSSTAGTIYFGPILYFLCKIFNCPLIIRQFGGGLDIKYKKMNVLQKRALELVLNCNRFLLETKGQVDYFKTNYPDSKVQWYPNSRPFYNKINDINNINNVNESTIKFVCIGHVKPDKGIFETIKAFKEVNVSKKQLHFYGPLFEGCSEEIFENIPGLKYCGVLLPKKVVPTLEQYDVLIMPSTIETEGYPGVVIEAYFAGLPVIVSNLRSMREIVRQYRTGILVEPGNTEKLKDALNYFLQNRNSIKEMKEEINSFSKQFSSDIWTKNFYDLCIESSEVER